MTNSNLTHIAFLLDRSGSMQSIKDDTEGGFDAFIAEQRTSPATAGSPWRSSTTSTRRSTRTYPWPTSPRSACSTRVHRAARLHRAPPTATGNRLAALPEDERPGVVIVGIMTDGHENSSHERTHPEVKALIEQQTAEYGWQFLYMGADQDAIEVGSSIGVAAANSMTYSRGKVAAAMAATSRNIGRTRAAVAAGASAKEAAKLLAFDDEQRAASRE